MPKIKVNLRNLTVTEKIARAQQIVAALTGNANFNGPEPPLSEVTEAVNNLIEANNNAQAARTEAKRRTALLGDSEEALDRVVMQLAGYVESVAGDDEDRIRSAGFEVRAVGAPTAAPAAAPTTLAATDGDEEGEVELSWDSVRGARSYIVQQTTDPQSVPWTNVGVAPRSSHVVEGLVSGTRYYFRVAAVTLNGNSSWSNHAVKVAP